MFSNKPLGEIDWFFICYAQICFCYPLILTTNHPDNFDEQKGILALKEGILPIQEKSGTDLES
jgi:hypothetical protein